MLPPEPLEAATLERRTAMRRFVVFLLLAALAMAGGCATSKQTGALVGAGAGAAVGAAVGHAAGNTAVGAILGAAVGGAAGAYIGNYMDKQAAEIERDLEGARVERVGEGIKITFSSGILFDVNKATLRPEAATNLGDLAVILQKYPDTDSPRWATVRANPWQRMKPRRVGNRTVASSWPSWRTTSSRKWPRSRLVRSRSRLGVWLSGTVVRAVPTSRRYSSPFERESTTARHSSRI
jgi:hypothetical protein